MIGLLVSAVLGAIIGWALHGLVQEIKEYREKP